MRTSTTPRTRAPATPQNATQTPRQGATQAGQSTPTKRQRKRKPHSAGELPSGAEVVDLTGDTPPRTAKKPRARGPQQQEDSPIPERRARRWRDHPPQSYLDRLERIRMQRFGQPGNQVVLELTYYPGCLSLATLWMVPVKSLKLPLTSSDRRAISTRQPSGRCQPATAPMLQRATNASTSATVSPQSPSFTTSQLYLIVYLYNLFLLMAYKVLLNALNAPCQLQYQLAFLSSVRGDIPSFHTQSLTDDYLVGAS